MQVPAPDPEGQQRWMREPRQTQLSPRTGTSRESSLAAYLTRDVEFSRALGSQHVDHPGALIGSHAQPGSLDVPRGRQLRGAGVCAAVTEWKAVATSRRIAKLLMTLCA